MKCLLVGKVNNSKNDYKNRQPTYLPCLPLCATKHTTSFQVNESSTRHVPLLPLLERIIPFHAVVSYIRIASVLVHLSRVLTFQKQHIQKFGHKITSLIHVVNGTFKGTKQRGDAQQLKIDYIAGSLDYSFLRSQKMAVLGVEQPSFFSNHARKFFLTPFNSLLACLFGSYISLDLNKANHFQGVFFSSFI